MLLTAVWMFGSSAWAADAIPSERRLPPDVMAYMSVPDVPALKAHWDDYIRQFQADPAFDDVRRQIGEQLDEVFTSIRQELGVTIKDLLELPSGDLSLAMLQLPDNKFGLVAFLNYGDSQETLEKLLEKVTRNLQDQGAESSITEIDGTEIRVHTIKPQDEESGEEDDAAPANPMTFAYFQRDSHFVFSYTVEVLETVLARWDGNHPRTLADNDVYRYIRERCQTSPDSQPAFVYFVNPIGMIQLALQAGASSDISPQVQLISGLLPTLGLTKIQGAGGVFEVATDEFSLVNRGLVYIDLPASGLLNVFRCPAIQQAPPEWVSANVSTYHRLNWDIPGAYAAIESLVDTFAGGPGTLARMIDQLADQEQGPKVHLKKDLLDHLSGHIHIVGDVPKTDDPANQRFLLAFGLANSDSIRATLSLVAKTPGFPGEVREFRGTTIYELRAPSPDADTRMAAAVTREALFLTSDVTLLEQIIRADADQKSLTESQEYRQIARHLPAKTSLISYEREDMQFRAVWKALRQGDEVSNLPPFEAIEKYWPIMGSYAVPDERGVMFVSFGLRRTGE